MADAVELAIDATLNLGRAQSDASLTPWLGFTTVEVVSLLKTAVVASVDTGFDLVVLFSFGYTQSGFSNDTN